ncbi:DUF362 domain-containing protein [Methanooceanicella nereidis]|nr:4Fe-4S binding protein [Methanocella sp. CWC-04]
MKVIKKAFPFRFIFARLTTLPVLGAAVDRICFENDDIIYIPMDKVIEVNKKIEQPQDTVLPSRIVEHFIEMSEYHWIMNRCICRDSANCKDYPVELGCIFLGEATLKIDPLLGRRVTKEEALEHVRRCGEAGLVHLIGRNKLDALWLNVGPDNKLLTICNCCPCCCLWKILPDLSSHISSKVTKMPCVSVSVTDRCTGCGKCTHGTCFVDAVSIVDGRAVISDQCRGCGRCSTVCPNQAIEIVIENDDFVERSIERISSSVEV